MFDSAFADWMPGRPALFGFPFHGRVDWPRVSTAQPPILTLPNARQIRLGEHLGYSHPGIREFEQTGNVIRFKDPRSTPPERSPDELAADAARGIEWRDSALVQPRTRTVHGLRLFGNDAWWVYSDGESVWGVYRESGGLYLYPQPTISRRAQPPRIFIPIDTSGVVPLDAGVPITQVVIDAVPDGSRVLIARFGEGLSTMPEGAYATSSPSGKAWRHTPLDFVEIEITRGEDGHQAVMRSVFDRDETAGEVILRDTPALKQAVYRFELTGAVNKGPKNPGSSTHIWELTYEVEFGATSGTGNFHPYAIIGSYSIEYGYRNRIVSAYYRPNGTIAKVTASAITSETHSCPGVSGSGTTAVVTCEGDAEVPDGITLTTDTLSLTASMSLTQGTTTAFELKNDGAIVGTGYLEISGSHSWSNEWSGIFGSDGFISGPGRSSGQSSVTFSRQWQLEIDGTSIGGGSTTEDDSYEYSDLGPSFSYVRHVLSTWNPSRGAYAEFNVRDSSDRSLRALLGPVSYCALMPAVLGAIYPASGSNAGTTNTYAIGNGSLPFSGGLHTGFTTGTGPMTEIFGSYNPVTGQFIRDAANPVSWV